MSIRSRRTEPRPVAGVRRLAAIMFTDMVGFTQAAQRHEALALDLLREEERLVRPIVAAHGGREVKSTGDGALVEFASTLQAVSCAVAIQRCLHERNAAADGSPIRLRVGLHVGDVEGRDSDIFGDAVNIAARVLSIAEPEGIALTEQVVHDIRNKVDLPIEELGPRVLKGVDRPVPLFRIVFPWSGPVPAPPALSHPRVAVLPLRNISPDPADAYFADGLTEELISVLGQVRELRVISRSSVARFQGQNRTIPEIGRELGASAVLEGSVRKAGDRLRISLQLVDVATQEGLWAQTFDRQLVDIFAVQAEVGERTASSLRVRLLGAERAALHRPSTTSLAAYGLYLQGLHLAASPTDEDHAASVELFRRAIQAAPDFTAAHAHLANALLGEIGEQKPAREVAPEVRRLIERALELDPEAAETHTAMGNLAMQVDLDWVRAEAEFRRAIGLSPSDLDARLWYGLLLRALQRYSEAADQARAAVELDPLSMRGFALLVSILRLSGDLEGAERITRASLQRLMPPPEFHCTLAYTYAYGGRVAEAQRELERAAEGGRPGVRQDSAVLRARLGDATDVRKLLTETERKGASTYTSPLQLATLAAAAGEPEKAFAYLERDWSEGDRGLWFVYQGICFDPIRSDPRFTALLERARLPVAAPFHRGRQVG